jgi:tetratricopeptide (TPR) repeat protein
MPTYKLLAVVCLSLGVATAQFKTDSCVSATSGVIPPASVGHLCDPQTSSLQRLERELATEPKAVMKPRTASVSYHQLTHEVPGKARKAYLAAERSKANGEPAKAISFYKKALELDPQYLEAWNNLGSAQILANDFSSAQTSFEKAYALDPTAHPVLTNLAFLLLRKNRPAEAESFARRAVQADPLAPRGLYVLGVSLAGQNKETEEAIRLLEQSCDTVGRAHFALAPLLAQSNRLREAADHLKKYLALPLPPDRDIAEEWLSQVEAELRRR